MIFNQTFQTIGTVVQANINVQIKDVFLKFICAIAIMIALITQMRNFAVLEDVRRTFNHVIQQANVFILKSFVMANKTVQVHE